MTTATTTAVSQISDADIREALRKGQYIQVGEGQAPRFVQFAPTTEGEKVVSHKDVHLAEPTKPDIVQTERVNIPQPDEVEHEHVNIYKAPPPRVIKRTEYNVLPPTRKKRTFVTVHEPTRPVSPTHHVMLRPFEHEGRYYHYPVTGPAGDVYHTVHGMVTEHPEYAHLESPMLSSFVVVDPDEHEGDILIADPHHDHVHDYYD